MPNFLDSFVDRFRPKSTEADFKKILENDGSLLTSIEDNYEVVRHLRKVGLTKRIGYKSATELSIPPEFQEEYERLMREKPWHVQFERGSPGDREATEMERASSRWLEAESAKRGITKNELGLSEEFHLIVDEERIYLRNKYHNGSGLPKS